jgi:ketosteroid isomerase-like protein
MNETERKKEIQQIKNAINTAMEAQNRGDKQGALTSYSENMISLPPGAPVITGLDHMRQDRQQEPKTHTEYKLNHIDVSESGDMGYFIMEYKMTIHTPTGKTTHPGKSHGTLKKENGKWKVKVLSWNNNP